MKVKLRIAEESDIPILLQMMENFAKMFGYRYDLKKSDKSLREFIPVQHLGNLYLIENNNKSIGYVALTFGYSFGNYGRDAIIDELYVEEDYRNKGIGTEALNLIEEESVKLGLKKLYLEVEKYNQAAYDLYDRIGYENTGRFLMGKNIAVEG